MADAEERPADEVPAVSTTEDFMNARFDEIVAEYEAYNSESPERTLRSKIEAEKERMKGSPKKEEPSVLFPGKMKGPKVRKEEEEGPRGPVPSAFSAAAASYEASAAFEAPTPEKAKRKKKKAKKATAGAAATIPSQGAGFPGGMPMGMPMGMPEMPAGMPPGMPSGMPAVGGMPAGFPGMARPELGPVDDDLVEMLMSWYYAGYFTGRQSVFKEMQQPQPQPQ